MGTTSPHPNFDNLYFYYGCPCAKINLIIKIQFLLDALWHLKEGHRVRGMTVQNKMN